MVEIECTLEHAGAVLAGTLSLPSGTGRAPCVLMLPASGPLDRDENYKGQQVNAFNAIAHHLASKGFASVRYDKRGCGNILTPFNYRYAAAMIAFRCPGSRRLQLAYGA